MPTESKRYFVLVISGVGVRVSEGGEGLGLFSTQSKCFWLVVEEGTTASNNRNHLWVIHLWCSQKWTVQQRNPQSSSIPSPLFKNERIWKHVKILRPPTPPPPLAAVIWIFFCFRKNHHPQNHQSSKYYLKTLLSYKVVDCQQK